MLGDVAEEMEEQRGVPEHPGVNIPQTKLWQALSLFQSFCLYRSPILLAPCLQRGVLQNTILCTNKIHPLVSNRTLCTAELTIRRVIAFTLISVLLLPAFETAYGMWGSAKVRVRVY